MKFLLEHKLPRTLRYARVYFEAGPTSLHFSLDGTSADWHATIGKKRRVEMTDAQYARLRSEFPAIEMLDDNGRSMMIKNAAGYEEQWEKPRWVLVRARKKSERDD